MIIAEIISLPLGVDRRLCGMSTRRDHLHHTMAVLAARPAFLVRHQGRIPRWDIPAGVRLRTVIA